MAERPTYKRRGAQLKLPAFQDIMSQVAARGANETAQAINGMAQFVAQQTQNYAQIKGEEYGALHAPTRKQIEHARETGADIDLPGGNFTVADRAARKAALAVTSDNLQHLAQARITEIVLEAYETQSDPTALAADIDAVIAGYADTLDKNAPTLALNWRAKMGMYAHSEYKSYAKSLISTSSSSNKAELARIFLGEHSQVVSGGLIN